MDLTQVKQGMSDRLSVVLRKVLHEEAPRSWPKRKVKEGALQLLNRGIGFGIPFAPRNGFKVVEIREGYLKSFIPIKGNRNHFGGMYAGALFTVGEIPGGVLAILNFDTKYFPLLKDMKVTFDRVAKSDVTVEFQISQEERMRIEKEADREGKCDFVLKGEIKDTKGETVAYTEGLYQLRCK